MRNILIKIGKIKSILERDGFWGGLKNICSKVFKVLKGILRWSNSEIVFISGVTGNSAMYRTDHIAEELREYGFKTDVLYIDDPFLLFKIKNTKVIILHRVAIENKIQKLLKQAESLQQNIIYDTDDLIFDITEFKKTDSYKKFNNLQKMQYEKGIGLEILKSDQLEAISAPTSFLAEKLQRFHKPVYVVKSKLSKQELKWTREARKIYLNRIQKEGDVVKIGYFSGSVSHNKDFATIIAALEIILNRYQNVELYLVGYLDTSDIFYKKFKERVVQLPFVSRRKHYQNIAEIDINLAPLEMNDFCQAKSELKFFEAGIIGIPTVAVRNQTFSEAIIEGKDGLLASNTEEWVCMLEKLIDDKELRIVIGEKARQKVLRKYLTGSGDNQDYYKFLDDKINKLNKASNMNHEI